MAKRLAIELLFLPSHSPDLNLIGWMWKSTKIEGVAGQALRRLRRFPGGHRRLPGSHPTDHREALASRMPLNFRTCDDALSLTA